MSSSSGQQSATRTVGGFHCEGTQLVGKVGTNPRDLTNADIEAGNAACSGARTDVGAEQFNQVGEFVCKGTELAGKTGKSNSELTNSEIAAGAVACRTGRMQTATTPTSGGSGGGATTGSATASGAAGGAAGGAAAGGGSSAATTALGSFESRLQAILGATSGGGGRESEVHGFVCRGVDPIGMVGADGSFRGDLSAGDMERGQSFCRMNAAQIGVPTTTTTGQTRTTTVTTGAATGAQGGQGAPQQQQAAAVAHHPQQRRPHDDGRTGCPLCPACVCPADDHSAQQAAQQAAQPQQQTTTTTGGGVATVQSIVAKPTRFTVGPCSGDLMRVDVEGHEGNPCILKLCDAGRGDVGIRYLSGGQEELCKVIAASEVVGTQSIVCANRNPSDIKLC